MAIIMSREHADNPVMQRTQSDDAEEERNKATSRRERPSGEGRAGGAGQSRYATSGAIRTALLRVWNPASLAGAVAARSTRRKSGAREDLRVSNLFTAAENIPAVRRRAAPRTDDLGRGACSAARGHTGASSRLPSPSRPWECFGLGLAQRTLRYAHR